MKTLMEYKNYHAAIQYDDEDKLFIGTIIGINDSISFHGKTVKELKRKLKSSIDDYVAMCHSVGKEPEKEYSGNMNIKITHEDHQKAKRIAEEKGISINKLFSSLIHSELQKKII